MIFPKCNILFSVSISLQKPIRMLHIHTHKQLSIHKSQYSTTYNWIVKHYKFYKTNDTMIYSISNIQPKQSIKFVTFCNFKDNKKIYFEYHVRLTFECPASRCHRLQDPSSWIGHSCEAFERVPVQEGPSAWPVSPGSILQDSIRTTAHHTSMVPVRVCWRNIFFSTKIYSMSATLAQGRRHLRTGRVVCGKQVYVRVHKVCGVPKHGTY